MNRKILVVSDVENYEYFEYNTEALKDVLFVVSCGDLPVEYLKMISLLLGKKVYYLCGNHGKRKFGVKNTVYVGNKVVAINGIVIAGIDGIEAENAFKIKKAAKRLLRKNKPVDILVTHSPTKGFGDGEGYHEGSNYFPDLYDKLSVRYHLYGHNHLNYGGKRELVHGKTKLINGYDHFIIEI